MNENQSINQPLHKPHNQLSKSRNFLDMPVLCHDMFYISFIYPIHFLLQWVSYMAPLVSLWDTPSIRSRRRCKPSVASSHPVWHEHSSKHCGPRALSVFTGLGFALLWTNLSCSKRNCWLASWGLQFTILEQHILRATSLTSVPSLSLSNMRFTK